VNAISTIRNVPACDLASPDRIRATDPVYQELREHLEDEMALLDENRFYEWLDTLADDLRYQMPVRASVHRAAGDGFARRMFFYNDTKSTLAMRIQRLLGSKAAWVEDPPSRISRLVANVRIYKSTEPAEYLLESNLLLTRSRTDAPEVKLLSARRRDLLRRTDDGLRLARREIFLDQSSIDMHNLAIFF